jgi:hypothetical protein
MIAGEQPRIRVILLSAAIRSCERPCERQAPRHSSGTPRFPQLLDFIQRALADPSFGGAVVQA